MRDEARVESPAFTFTAHYSPLRRRWIGRCTCGATLKPIFRERSCDLPLFFMEVHGKADHPLAA